MSTTSDLKPLPQPGLAAFPHLVQHESVTFTLKREILGKELALLLPDGRKLLAVTGKSPSEGRCFIDVATDHVLTVIRNGKNDRTYYAETTSGTRTFDVESEEDCIILHCSNVLDEKQRTQIEFHSEVEKGVHGEVKWQGSTVARIDKEKHRIPRRQYQLQVAPGMDPFLVLAIAVILISQRKTKSKPEDAGTAVPTNDGATSPRKAGVRMSHTDLEPLKIPRAPEKRYTSTHAGGNGAAIAGLGALAASSAAGGGCSGCGGGGGGGGCSGCGGGGSGGGGGC